MSLACRERGWGMGRFVVLEHVWGGEAEVTTNTVDRYVAYLRRKLGEPPLIETVRGIGFRLRAP